ncbi:MAG: phosphoribosylformylglycinamidine cyclo-ligase, partial [Firmicutes bacterium]|nr:phosphoribosylformylglycinamidine cyclo-ligase [Bacillota bacterium]
MITYKESGVDVAAADKLTEEYKAVAAAASTPHVLGGIGGFAGFLALPEGYERPVLVACTDGVGTKLRLLIDHGEARTAGKDAAAMCLNDLATCGAQPLFMLDYLAVGKLDPAVAQEVVAGFADYCCQAGCALIGGETAEMPGFYPPGDFDVAGFAVGVVEKEGIVDGRGCQAGNLVLGLASSGVHSNGFSLVRLLLDRGLLDLERDCGGMPLKEALLQPTRLYLPLGHRLGQVQAVKAMAHITGGGLPGNVGRTIPDSLDTVIEWGSWPRPAVFALIAQAGVPRQEMLATFNLGIGYTLVVDKDYADSTLELCHQSGVEAWVIGSLR